MHNFLKKLKKFVALGLITVTTSCSDLKPNITEADLDKAIQAYSEKVESETSQVITKEEPKVETEQEGISSNLLLRYIEEPLPESISNLDINKQQTTLADFLIPDKFLIQLNTPFYSLNPEKREIRFWNNVTNLLGYHGRIKSFSDRTTENTFLELEGKYFFSRLTKEEWARRTSLGLKFSYGKDTVESHLTHPILPPLDIDITDELLGIGLNLNYYPEIKLKDILLKLTTGIDYKHLVVDADPRLGTFKIEGFDSEGSGLGYYLRIGIETIPGRIKILPKDTILFLAAEYRHEKIHSDPTSENIGPGVIMGIKKSLR
ncbi:hypothetical protein HYV88_03525 [Candidatus Woesearchaeota archaeon]|nr:hypothetical protein [Candidatus Woesearchaeota archaeon]